MRDSTTSMKSFAVGTCARAWTRDGRWGEGERQEPPRREEEPRGEGVSAEVGWPHLGRRGGRRRRSHGADAGAVGPTARRRSPRAGGTPRGRRGGTREASANPRDAPGGAQMGPRRPPPRRRLRGVRASRHHDEPEAEKMRRDAREGGERGAHRRDLLEVVLHGGHGGRVLGARRGSSETIGDLARGRAGQ